MRSVIVLILLLFVVSSCGTAGKVYRLANPRDIDKESLADRKPDVITSKYKFRLVILDYGGQTKSWWSEFIDSEYEEYSTCVKEKLGKDPDPDKLRKQKIIITRDGHFDCKYHSGRCNGEYDSGLNTIFLTRKALDREGFVPLLKHEWSHANGLLRSDHKNHDDLKICTRY